MFSAIASVIVAARARVSCPCAQCAYVKCVNVVCGGGRCSTGGGLHRAQVVCDIARGQDGPFARLESARVIFDID